MVDTTKKVDSQGHNAVKTGKWLENKVENLLAKYGIKSVFHSKLDTEEANSTIISSPCGILIKNVPYVNSLGENGYGEFVLNLYGIGTYRIECRNQNVRGSAQDKLFKLLEDCMVMEEKNVFIVMEGNGYTEGARTTMYRRAKAIMHKNVMVKTLHTFTSWVEDTLGVVPVVKKRMVIVPDLHKTTKCRTLKTKESK